MKRNWFVLSVLLVVVALAANRLLETPSVTIDVSAGDPTNHSGTLDALESRFGDVRVVEASVVDVIDGDTVVVASATGTDKVRYVGVDTPERDRPFSDVATRLNSALVRGRTVRLVMDRGQERDNHGRWLAAVFVESEDGSSARLINDELVRAGVAHTYFKGKNVVQDTLRESLILSQRTALDEQQGLWSEATNRLGSDAQNGPVAATRFRFHRADCGHVAQTQTTWLTRSEALRSGRSPCRTCAP
jgi:endonuclease YncB( thermonuclease family)